jgi:hypothetical protein
VSKSFCQAGWGEHLLDFRAALEVWPVFLLVSVSLYSLKIDGKLWREQLLALPLQVLQPHLAAVDVDMQIHCLPEPATQVHP